MITRFKCSSRWSGCFRHQHDASVVFLCVTRRAHIADRLKALRSFGRCFPEQRSFLIRSNRPGLAHLHSSCSMAPELCWKCDALTRQGGPAAMPTSSLIDVPKAILLLFYSWCRRRRSSSRPAPRWRRQLRRRPRLTTAPGHGHRCSVCPQVVFTDAESLLCSNTDFKPQLCKHDSRCMRCTSIACWW